MEKDIYEDQRKRHTLHVQAQTTHIIHNTLYGLEKQNIYTSLNREKEAGCLTLSHIPGNI